MSKEYKITSASEYDQRQDFNNDHWSIRARGGDSMQVSDGYHTMDELYEHRIQLFITLCRYIEAVDQTQTGPNRVWRSKLHDNGSEYEGWFILGIGRESGKIITYHLPNNRWDEVSFADTLETAPEFDGHTPDDVLERLKTI